MANPLLEALGFVGNVLDTPGSVARGLLAGEPSRAIGGVFDPSKRVYGRDLLQNWGLQEEGDQSWGGFFAGLGAEIATDPLNLIPGALGAKSLARARAAARETNALREAMLAAGAMPEELAAITKARHVPDEPLRLYHGTDAVYDKFNLDRASRGNLAGPGYYMTSNPEIASGYTSGRIEPPRAQLDVMPSNASQALLRDMLAHGGSEFFTGPPAVEGLSASGFRPLRDLVQSGADVEEIARLNKDQLFSKIGEFAHSAEQHLVENPGALNLARWKWAEQYPELTKTFGVRVVEPTPSPSNVRMQYLFSENPLDLDQRLTPELYERLENAALGQVNPALRGELAAGDITAFASPEQRNVFDWVQHTMEAGYNPMKAAQAAGYDAYRHMGGMRIPGPDLHDVWIAFSPDQIYAPWVAPTAQRAPSYNSLLAAMGGQNVLSRTQFGGY